MPKDNLPVNKPRGIELLEPEMRPEQSDLRAGAGRHVITIVGLAVVVGLGLMLLPDPAPLDTDLEGALPAPVVATNLPPPEPAAIGLIGLDSFPLQFEPSLEGYVRLAGPAFGNGSYWMIGTGEQPTLLTSSDGVAWSRAGPFPADDERLVAIHRLIGHQGVLIAVGTEGSQSLDEDPLQRLQVWRSADGVTWIPEEVASGSTFLDSNMTVDGQQIVVTASDAIGHDHLYRSSFFGLWQEIAITFSTANGIIRAPDGGFLLSTGEGSILTSANGVNWSPNTSFDNGMYSQWNDQVVGTDNESGQLMMRVIGEEGASVTELPDSLEGCQVRGGPAGLLALCPSESGSAFNLYLSENGLLWQRSQSAILTDELIYLGYTNAGFLIATEGLDGTLLVARAALP
ncbi:hypothetical protein BH18ACT6_BH18ACT6_02980 [soil metagenome]